MRRLATLTVASLLVAGVALAAIEQVHPIPHAIYSGVRGDGIPDELCLVMRETGPGQWSALCSVVPDVRWRACRYSDRNGALRRDDCTGWLRQNVPDVPRRRGDIHS